MPGACLVFLSGCTTPLTGHYGPIGHSSDQFEHYVEEVFKFQNRMTSEVMMLQETGEIDVYDRILKSEQNMQQICAPLNEYVSRDIDGLSTGLFLRRRVMRSTFDCDHAAHEVKDLLDEL